MLTSRRSFLRTATLATSALSASRVMGANDRIRVASIGLGGQGRGNAGRIASVPGVELAMLCDPDTAALDQAKSSHPGATTVQDLRKVIDAKDIDAVVVSTGNYWHVLAALWACQAGKDVYVEKPISHNIWEGRQLVQAARKYKRIVQGGTQQRSCPVQAEIKAFLDSGKLGKVKWVRCNHYSIRPSIGKRAATLAPPTTCDYHLWLGPAQDLPILREKFHYDWHWNWNTGNGELGNWGPHILDDLRNIVFRDKITLPRRVMAGGGRLGLGDAGETPNTHFVYYDTGDVPVIMDVHNLPRARDVKANDFYRRRRSSAFLIIECENGYYAGGRGGGKAYDAAGKEIAGFSGDGGKGHAANFIEAMRSGKSSDLNAEIEQIHYSSAWCHLGNIAYRLGRNSGFEQAKASLKDLEQWQEVTGDCEAHLAANQITLQPGDLQVSPLLEIDPARETFTGASATPEALALLRREYRKGFEVPEAL